jgi:hypothetical protein
MSVSCECCVCVEVPATGRSLVQRIPTDCNVSLRVIQCNNNILHVTSMAEEVGLNRFMFCFGTKTFQYIQSNYRRLLLHGTWRKLGGF